MRNIVYIGMQSEWIKECAEHSHSFGKLPIIPRDMA